MRVSDTWLNVVGNLLRARLEIPDDRPLINPHQAEAVWALRNGVRNILLCGGIQAGKSFMTAVLTLLAVEPPYVEDVTQAPLMRVWIVGPDYYQARTEFQYIHDVLAAGGMIKSSSMPQNTTSPWQLETIWNCKIETRSSADVTKLASYALDVCVMSEAAQQDYEVFLRAQERTVTKRGIILLSGTLEQGLPWYGDLLRRWKAPNEDGGFALSLPTWSNTAVFPGGWDDPEIQRIYRYHADNGSLDHFWERYGAEPRKATGLVIPEFDFQKHVRRLEPVEGMPVELWIDPGKNAYAVLFVQCVGPTTYVLDRVYRRGAIAQDVIPECMEKPLWEMVKHPNVTSHGVIDIAGKHQYGLPSHIEVWKDMAGVVLRSNYVHQDVGRDVVRFRLRTDATTGEPLLFFNSHFTNAKAHDGTALDVLAEFELWRWREQGQNSSEPRRPIDANNHAIKALGYGLYDKYGAAEGRKFVRRRHVKARWKTI